MNNRYGACSYYLDSGRTFNLLRRYFRVYTKMKPLVVFTYNSGKHNDWVNILDKLNAQISDSISKLEPTFRKNYRWDTITKEFDESGNLKNISVVIRFNHGQSFSGFNKTSTELISG